MAPAPQTAIPVANSAQNEANKQQYEQSLAQASFEKAHADLQKKFGQNRMAVVVIDGVPGPSAEADHYLERKLFKALYTMKVDSGRLEEVGDALVQYGTSSTWAWHTSDDLVRAIETWSTDKTTRFLVRQLGEFSWDKKQIMQALARHPTEEGARAVATLMTDRNLALDASATLRDMGPMAEDTVYKPAQDRFPSMRIEAYDILRTIGTAKSLSRLKSLNSKEKDKNGREALKQAIAGLEERLAAEGGGTGVAAPKK